MWIRMEGVSMPFGSSGLIFLLVLAVMLAVMLAVARFILIQTVRIVRREWTRPDPPSR